MVAKGLCGEDLSKCHCVRVLNLLPHVYQHHALRINKAETWTVANHRGEKKKHKTFNTYEQNFPIMPTLAELIFILIWGGDSRLGMLIFMLDTLGESHEKNKNCCSYLKNKIKSKSYATSTLSRVMH